MSAKKPAAPWRQRVAAWFELDRAGVERAATITGWVVVLGLVAGGWVMFLPRLKAYAAPHVASSELEVVLMGLPAWLEGQPGERARLEEAVRTNISADPFDHAALLHAQQALEQTGWFREVTRVSRTQANTVTVEGQYVEPFTTVQDEAGNHLVTLEGVLLPMRYPAQTRLRLPLITGARYPRPNEAGETWRGTDVQAGLALARLIERSPWVHQISTIDVSQTAAADMLWLTTDRGARILWGRRPGEELGREVPAKQKLAYLDWFFRETGRVESRYSEIDLTLDAVYTR